MELDMKIICILVFLLCDVFAVVDTNMLRSSELDKEHDHSKNDKREVTAVQIKYHFLESIFAKYGDIKVMSFEGFEHLLENLNIGNIQIDHGWKKHETEISKLIKLHVNHVHSLDNYGHHKHQKDKANKGHHKHQRDEATNEASNYHGDHTDNHGKDLTCHSENSAIIDHGDSGVVNLHSGIPDESGVNETYSGIHGHGSRIHDHDSSNHVKDSGNHHHGHDSENHDADFTDNVNDHDSDIPGGDSGIHGDDSDIQETKDKISTNLVQGEKHNRHHSNDNMNFTSVNFTQNETFSQFLQREDMRHDPRNERKRESYAKNKTDILKSVDGQYNISSELKTKQGSGHVESKKGFLLHIDKCFKPDELLHIYGYSENNEITPEQFLELCPALLFQIDIKRCNKNGAEGQTDSLNLLRSIADIPKEVWGFATCTILVISFAGLMVVSMIPLLRKMMMSSVLHFLIALAVGALSGDALLHLIPHSLQLHEETHGHQDGVGDEEASHSLNGVYKGLCGLVAIYFFLFFGRIQAIVGSRKFKGKHINISINISGEITQKIDDTSEYDNVSLSLEKDPYQNEPFILNRQNPEMILNGVGDDHKHIHELQSDDLEQGQHHGHSHSHGVPSSIPDLAWRVIIGDGIHNLCDGLAIGVAFANSVTGGIRTSIAVLCHELPHEMGDFAILLQKGMTVKQAILCNCISSVISLIGMVTGVLLGNIGQANLWIFVAVAGMFLYISLVDLIPELNTVVITNSGTKAQVKALLVQVSGMLTGSGIMFIIAIYEEQLKRILDV